MAVGFLSPLPTYTGLNLIETKTFTTQSAVQFDNCFTSTYDNYFSVINVTAISADNDIRVRFVDGTTPTSTQDYVFAYGGNYVSNGSTLTDYSTSSGATFITIGSLTSASTKTFSSNVFIYNPNKNTDTTISYSGTGIKSTARFSFNGGGNFLPTTVFEGIQFYPASGTFTGTASIYGIAK